MPVLSLLNLPTESLLHVLPSLDDESLLETSATCARLHEISLALFFRRHSGTILFLGGSQDTGKVLLVSRASPPQTFRALRSALFLKDLTHFKISFSQDSGRLLSNLWDLLTLIERMPSISFIALDFSALDERTKGLPRSNTPSLNSGAWQQSFTRLISSILERSCTDLRIEGARWIEKVCSERTSLQKPGSNSVCFNALFLNRWPWRAISRTLAQWAFPSFSLKLGMERKYTEAKTFVITQGTFLFIPPLQDWTMSTLKAESSKITILSLDSVQLSRSEWRGILHSLTFPSLMTFQLSRQEAQSLLAYFRKYDPTLQAPLLDTMDFLRRHTTVTYLHLHGLDLRPILSRSIGNPPDLPLLVTLTGHPRLISWLLSKSDAGRRHMSRHLLSVTISSEYHISLSDDPYFDHDFLNMVLSRVSLTSANHITVEFVGTLPHYNELWTAWFKSNEGSVGRIEGPLVPSLTKVTSLLLSFRFLHKQRVFDNNALDGLPRWLRSYFPNLKRIRYREDLHGIDIQDFNAFVKEVSLVCPTVEFMDIIGGHDTHVFDLISIRAREDLQMTF